MALNQFGVLKACMHRTFIGERNIGLCIVHRIYLFYLSFQLLVKTIYKKLDRITLTLSNEKIKYG